MRQRADGDDPEEKAMTAKNVLVIAAALTCSLYISLFPLLVVSCIRELIQGWRATARTEATAACPAPDPSASIPGY